MRRSSAEGLHLFFCSKAESAMRSERIVVAVRPPSEVSERDTVIGAAGYMRRSEGVSA